MLSRGLYSHIMARRVDISIAQQTQPPPPPHHQGVVEGVQWVVAQEEQQAGAYVTFTLRYSTFSPCAPASGTRVERSYNTPYPWSSHETSPHQTPTWSRERLSLIPSTPTVAFAACSATQASARCPLDYTASATTEDSINDEVPSKNQEDFILQGHVPLVCTMWWGEALLLCS